MAPAPSHLIQPHNSTRFEQYRLAGPRRVQPLPQLVEVRHRRHPVGVAAVQIGADCDDLDAGSSGLGSDLGVQPGSVIAELGQLTSAEETAEARAKGYAARLRWEQAQRDHAEAADAAAMFDGDQDGVVTPLRPRRAEGDDGFDIDAEWPDFDEVGD